MSLEQTSTQELIVLDNLLNDVDYTYEEWIEAFDNDEELTRTELIKDMKSCLKSYKYDGPDDYQSIYWFTKGLRIPKPKQPTRYVDSDEYLFNNLHKYKVQDKLDDFNRKRIHDKFDRELHKKDSSFLEELMKHQKELREFHHSLHDIFFSIYCQ